MSPTLTIAILLAALALAGFANWRERRPRALGSPPLVSYAALQMIAVVVAILMLAHLASFLLGHPLKSRYLG